MIIALYRICECDCIHLQAPAWTDTPITTLYKCGYYDDTEYKDYNCYTAKSRKLSAQKLIVLYHFIFTSITSNWNP